MHKCMNAQMHECTNGGHFAIGACAFEHLWFRAFVRFCISCGLGILAFLYSYCRYPMPAPDDPIRIPIEAELDLHPFAPGDIPSVVAEYVEAAAAAGFDEIRVIHGRGRGVQRGIVQAALERHARVVEFWDDPRAHLGATVARLITDS